MKENRHSFLYRFPQTAPNVDAQNRMVLEQRKSDRESARNVNDTRVIVVHPKVWATSTLIVLYFSEK
ncbi:hypothetical protein ACFX1Z_030055 [Malus domestica]